jgi:predicted RNase H-like HicB family nuclease
MFWRARFESGGGLPQSKTPARSWSAFLPRGWAGIIFPPMKFRVTVELDEDGVFVAECPALPGCVSQGKTREEAMANIRDAIQGYLASLEKHGEPIPPGITEEIIEIPA